MGSCLVLNELFAITISPSNFKRPPFPLSLFSILCGFSLETVKFEFHDNQIRAAFLLTFSRKRKGGF